MRYYGPWHRPPCFSFLPLLCSTAGASVMHKPQMQHNHSSQSQLRFPTVEIKISTAKCLHPVPSSRPRCQPRSWHRRLTSRCFRLSHPLLLPAFKPEVLSSMSCQLLGRLPSDGFIWRPTFFISSFVSVWIFLRESISTFMTWMFPQSLRSLNILIIINFEAHVLCSPLQ